MRSRWSLLFTLAALSCFLSGCLTKTGTRVDLGDVRLAGTNLLCIFVRETFTDSLLFSSMQHGTHLDIGPGCFVVAQFSVTEKSPLRPQKIWKLGEFSHESFTGFVLCPSNLAVIRRFSDKKNSVIRYGRLSDQEGLVFGAEMAMEPRSQLADFADVGWGLNAGLLNLTNRVVEVRLPDLHIETNSTAAKRVQAFVDSDRFEKGLVPGVITGDMEYFVGFDRKRRSIPIIDLKGNRPTKEIPTTGELTNTKVVSVNVLGTRMFLLLLQLERREWLIYDVEAGSIINSTVRDNKGFEGWTPGEPRIVFKDYEKEDKRSVRFIIWDWEHDQLLRVAVRKPRCR